MSSTASSCRVVARRLAVCEEVARIKEGSETPVIQPARVRDVVTTRRQWAIDAGIDPDFVEQLFRVLLTETHRIEVAKARPDSAPDKEAAPAGDRSGLDTVAARIDHVVVAVEDLETAVGFFTDRLGFHRQPLAGGDEPGVAAVVAGGVSIVLVGREAGPAIVGYLERHGSGVQHIAIEVLNAAYARAALAIGRRATADRHRRRRPWHGALLHGQGPFQRHAARLRLPNRPSGRAERRQPEGDVQGARRRMSVPGQANVAGHTTVPAEPANRATASSNDPMTARWPVRSANRQAASTFGPIEPSG